MNERRTAIDVSELPATVFDTRSTVWWGNILLTVIESMTVALLVTTYFYLSQNFLHWPPVNSNVVPPVFDTRPELLMGTCNAVLLLMSAAPMVVADFFARRLRYRPVIVALSLVTLMGLMSIALRIAEFQSLRMRWDDNAYGSVVWAILGLHLTYLILGTAECAILLLWLGLHGMDEKHAVDVTLSASYWYWVVGVWVLLYGVVYWSPRLMI